MADWSIFASGCKHAYILGETNVIYSFIMGNQLSLYDFLFNVPNGASCVNTWGSYHVWILLIPVKTCQRSTVLWVFTLFPSLIFNYFNITLYNFALRETLFVPSPTSHILRYSPDVANKSGLFPSYSYSLFGNLFTRSGTHMILVGGYSWSKVQHVSKSPFSSFNLMISTLFCVSSIKDPRESLKSLSGLLLKFIE